MTSYLTERNDKETTVQFFDVVAYLQAKRIDYATEGEHCTPGWINVDCPWCGDSTKHLGINLETNVMNCWRCGTHYIVKLIQHYEDCEWGMALKVMEEYQNYSRLERSSVPEWVPTSEVKIPKEFVKLKKENLGINDFVRPYTFLWGRGFKNQIEIFDKYGLYYSPGPTGDYSFRILIPVYIHQKLVTYMTRACSEAAHQPYKACEPKDEVIPIKQTLYGYDWVAPGYSVVIVEGALDQWKLGNGSLATWGTGWTMQQVALLRTLHPKKVYILYDSEEIAQEQAKGLSKAIWYCDSEVMYLDNHKDPGELSMEEGRQVMRELI